MQEYTEREKILIIFTICFLHFYNNFSYESNFTFEDYFNQNLIKQCTRYNVFLKDIKQFKIFTYSFYYQLIKEIKNLNYNYYKSMYHFYNPSALEQEKNILRQVEANKPNVGSNLSNMMVFFKNYITIFNQPSNYQNLKTNLQKIVNRKIMTPLVSTTERVVDMVLSVKYFIKSKD